MIIRDKDMSDKAFNGNFYVVGKISGKAIQSDRTQERAEESCQILNDHNAKNGHEERYSVQTENPQ